MLWRTTGMGSILMLGLVGGCAHPDLVQAPPQFTPDYPVVPREMQNLDVRSLAPEPGLSNPNCGLNGAPGIEREILERINLLRSMPRMCGAVRYEAAPPVRWNLQLLHAAYRHSVDMARSNLVSHTSLDARELRNRINQTGYVHDQAGENIAAGQKSVAQVVNDWINSPSHCATMMTTELVEVGAACVFKRDSFYRFYWTLDMAKPSEVRPTAIERREANKEYDWKEAVVR